jgi:hypothetical protein
VGRKAAIRLRLKMRNLDDGCAANTISGQPDPIHCPLLKGALQHTRCFTSAWWRKPTYQRASVGILPQDGVRRLDRVEKRLGFSQNTNRCHKEGIQVGEDHFHSPIAAGFFPEA